VSYLIPAYLTFGVGAEHSSTEASVWAHAQLFDPILLHILFLLGRTSLNSLRLCRF